MKTCTHCKQTFQDHELEDNFYYHHSNIYVSQCKKCMRIYNKRRRALRKGNEDLYPVIRQNSQKKDGNNMYPTMFGYFKILWLNGVHFKGYKEMCAEMTWQK